MKRILLSGMMLTLILSVSWGSDFADRKMDAFFATLQTGKYREGITELLTGSVLEEKVINVNQTMNNWVNQFTQIRSIYGDYLGYEKAVSIELGSLEETTYFVHCRDYPIQIVITEYDNGRQIQLVNMVFNDEVLETLRQFGELSR